MFCICGDWPHFQSPCKLTQGKGKTTASFLTTSHPNLLISCPPHTDPSTVPPIAYTDPSSLRVGRGEVTEPLARMASPNWPQMHILLWTLEISRRVVWETDTMAGESIQPPTPHCLQWEALLPGSLLGPSQNLLTKFCLYSIAHPQPLAFFFSSLGLSPHLPPKSWPKT